MYRNISTRMLALLLIAAVPVILSAQAATVTGRVVDETTLEPLAGANVMLEGTVLGASAGVDGYFRIPVPASMLGQEVNLTAGFIGYFSQTETIILAAGEIVQNFALGIDPIRTQEVIAIGYGSARKEELTGSIRVIRSEKLEQIPTSTFQDVLQGNPGVHATASDGTPGGRIHVRIRGIGSIGSSNEPLYVVDGIPVISYLDGQTDFDNGGRSANVLATLNPNDFENIVVLKDAASTAIYGSRGANGVILITTKGGVAGTGVRVAKAKFNVKLQQGYSDFAFNNLLTGLNADQYETLFFEGYANSDKATPEEAQEMFDTWFPEDANTNWRDVITRTGATQQFNLSAQGGSDRFNYYVSAGIMDQEGVIIANYFTRYSSRVNLRAQISDRLHIANNMNLAYTMQRGITDGSAWEAPIYNSLFLAPQVPIYDEAGEYYFGHKSFLLSGANPVGSAEVDERELEQTRIIDNIAVTYKLTNDLRLQSTWSFDIINYDEFIYENGDWGDGRAYGGRSNEARTDVINWQGIQTLNYTSTFGTSHNVDVLLGTEAQRTTRDYVEAYGGGFAHTSLHTLNTAANPLNARSMRTAYTFLSMLSRANYNYQNKYYVSGSFRRDGSSRFGPESRWGNFWSVGLGYTLTEESFMQGLTIIDYLKIRGSYGITGNAGIGNFEWAGLYGFARDYDGKPGASPTQISNPNLTWESQSNMNIGTDFAFLNNRLSGTFDWFSRLSSDLLLERPVSFTTGFSNVLKNVSDMTNTGIELSLQADILRKKDLLLSANFNVTKLTNEITYLPEPYIDDSKRRCQGHDFYEFYLYSWAGVDPANGDPLWYTDSSETETTNKIGDAERFYEGKSALPKTTGSFGLVAKVGPFSLSAQFNYQFGNYIYDGVARFYHADGRYTPRSTSSYAFENRWTPTHTDALFPQWRWGGNQGSNANYSNRNLYKGDYIRMKVLKLAFNLPQTLISRMGVSSVEAYVHLGNFWTWVADSELYIDPEQIIQGNYQSVTPISKVSSFGINIEL